MVLPSACLPHGDQTRACGRASRASVSWTSSDPACTQGDPGAREAGVGWRDVVAGAHGWSARRCPSPVRSRTPRSGPPAVCRRTGQARGRISAVTRAGAMDRAPVAEGRSGGFDGGEPYDDPAAVGGTRHRRDADDRADPTLTGGQRADQGAGAGRVVAGGPACPRRRRAPLASGTPCPAHAGPDDAQGLNV